LATIARSSSQRGSLGPRPPVKPVQRDDHLITEPVSGIYDLGPTRRSIDRFMHDVAGGITAGRQKTRPRGLSIVRGGHGVATRTIGLLGAIFAYAVRKGLRIDIPADEIVTFAEHPRERRLSDDEYRQLGNALLIADLEGIWKPAVAATWLMILTEWRRGNP
jgi:hypothetical protein